MWSRSLVLALLLLPAPALAGVKENVAALAPQGLVLVMDAKGNELVAQNIDEPFVPASVTKIVTAWLAMEVLGGDYRFKTCLPKVPRWDNRDWDSDCPSLKFNYLMVLRYHDTWDSWLGHLVTRGFCHPLH